MTIHSTESQETAKATAPATAEKSEPLKKANTRARKPHVASAKGKSGKKAASAKKAAPGFAPPGIFPAAFLFSEIEASYLLLIISYLDCISHRVKHCWTEAV